jgi:hypothetical protein
MKGIGQVQDVIVRELPGKEEKYKYGLVAGSRYKKQDTKIFIHCVGNYHQRFCDNLSQITIKKTGHLLST